MKVIFCLGNVGSKYKDTRHNAGFIFADALREFLGWDRFWDVGNWENDEDFMAEVCHIKGDASKLMIVKPTTLMNRSGLSAKRVVSRNSIDVKNDFILVHDDLDIELGKYKIQVGRAPKQHNGVDSVENMLPLRAFLRVRIGVDNRAGDRSMDPDEYVLQQVPKGERELLDEGINDAVKSLRTIAEF